MSKCSECKCPVPRGREDVHDDDGAMCDDCDNRLCEGCRYGKSSWWIPGHHIAVGSGVSFDPVCPACCVPCEVCNTGITPKSLGTCDDCGLWLCPTCKPLDAEYDPSPCRGCEKKASAASEAGSDAKREVSAAKRRRK